MILLFLLENGSVPIISLPELFQSFWTSEFIVFEMNSRLSSAYRSGVIGANTNNCTKRAAEKIFSMNFYFFFRPSRLKGDWRRTEVALPMAGRDKVNFFQSGNPHASRNP